MRKLVRDLRRVPAALGDGVKRRSPTERKPLEKMGKKLVAARELPAGSRARSRGCRDQVTGDGGVPPYELDNVVGRRLVRALGVDENVTFEVLEPAATPAAVAAEPA